MGSIVNGLIVGIGRWGDLLVASAQKIKDINFTHGVAFTRANVEEFCINCDMKLTDDYAIVLKKRLLVFRPKSLAHINRAGHEF